MAKIIIGKITDVEMEDDKAYIKIQDKRLKVSNKAMWGILRTHFTRKIDKEVKDHKEEYLEDNSKANWPIEFRGFFHEKMVKSTKRELQFIMDDDEKQLIAVATLKHSLMKPDEVYQIVTKTVEKMGLSSRYEEAVVGRIVHMKKTKWADYGLQVVAGDLTTYRAISVSLFVQAKQMGLGCLNPLTFLDLKRDLVRRILGEIPTVVTPKIFRYESKTQIPARIERSIESMKPYLVELEKRMAHFNFPKIQDEQAKTLLSSIGSSYGLGRKVIQECFDDYNKRKTKNLLSLSMSTSQVAKHKPKSFRKGTKWARQHLADISGALLLISNVQKATTKAKKYLGEHPEAKEIYNNIRP